MVQEPDGFLCELARPIENLVQQRANGGQAGRKNGRLVFTGKLLEIHDQAVDWQEAVVLAWFDECQFLAQLRQNLSRTGQNRTVLFGNCHMAG